MQVEKTAFISYRRTNIYMARAVYQDLMAHGYDAFLDYESIDAGSFEQIILNQIAARAHFVVVLTPSALERCTDPNDWLRREIEYALEMKRNIVPLMFEGFSFKDVQQYLVGKLAVLPQYNALEIPPAYFEEAMERLRTRFLNKSLDVILHPMPKADETQVKQAQAKEIIQPAVNEDQLTAEQWMERGGRRNKDDYDGKIADFTQAIQLNPSYAVAYYLRGLARHLKEDFDGAISDFTEAIRLKPKDVGTYQLRGIAYDFNGDFMKANADYQRYIDLGGPEAEKVSGWIQLNEHKKRKR